ncbi:MAG: hypothetical protein ACHQT6_01890 [Candidatus Acidiferrales bacterium]
MRFPAALFFCSLCMLCFIVAAWSTPYPSRPASHLSPAAETKFVSGKIASVADAEFSLEVSTQEKPSTLQFQLDGNTQLEGTLAVGSQASVDYRTASGKMIATHVIVTPASGVSLY